jgi:hypothetical protein
VAPFGDCFLRFYNHVLPLYSTAVIGRPDLPFLGSVGVKHTGSLGVLDVYSLREEICYPCFIRLRPSHPKKANPCALCTRSF